jgi:urea transport system permease protein
MKLLPWGGQWLFLLLLALWGIVPVQAQSPKDASFLSMLGELREAGYSDKATIAEHLSQTGHPSVRAVLTALMEDRLYFRNSDQKVFIVKSSDADPLSLIDPLSLKNAGSAPSDSLTKIGTNNGLRSRLRATVAHFSLSSPETAVRLDAVREMSRSLDDATVALLRDRLIVETNSGVRKEIATGLALPSWTDRTQRRVSMLSPRLATASARTCGTEWHSCSINLPTAASSKKTRM